MANKQIAHLQFESNRPWENYHQNVQFTPRWYCDVWNFWDDNTTPDTRKWEPGFRAIQKIIQDAENAGESVRALGGGWSLSHAVETDGFLVNTKPLNIIEVGFRASSCDPAYLAEKANQIFGPPEDYLVFAQCGASIAELNVALETRGLSLSTSGASNGQTICGALSTGTHGAAWRFGSVQEFVVAIHLISATGQSYWIEPNTRVVSQHFLDILDGPGRSKDTQRINDDKIFNATLVSFGSFGIIHAVVLRAEPIYLLERHVVLTGPLREARGDV
jgi:FAD/FMN-containing dehydrogenase